MIRALLDQILRRKRGQSAAHSVADQSRIESVPRQPHPANVPGPFYVEDGCCLACGVWEQDAPDLLAWLPDAEIPHCYVARQPVSDDEFVQMMTAMQSNEVDCIRVRDCKVDWQRQLREAGLGMQIDSRDSLAKL